MKKSPIYLIAACTKDGIIGINGKLPWDDIPEDLVHFKMETIESVVIMGKSTYQSLVDRGLNSLPRRINIVVSKTMHDSHKIYKNILVVDTLKKAINIAKQLERKIFLIGGYHIYEEGMKYADQLIITELNLWIAEHKNFYYGIKCKNGDINSSSIAFRKDEDTEELNITKFPKISSFTWIPEYVNTGKYQTSITNGIEYRFVIYTRRRDMIKSCIKFKL